MRSPSTPAWPPVVLQVLPAMKEGGVERSTIEMAGFLAKSGRKSLVASAGGPLTPRLAEVGAHHTLLPMASKNPFTMLGNVFRLRRLILEENVSIVHARSRAPAWSAWAAARWCGVPFVCTFHGTYGLGGGDVKRFYNSVMLRSPTVVANSLFIKDHIVREYGYKAADIVVAPRGIDPDVFDPALFTAADRAEVLSDLNVPKGTPLLLMVGRLTPWKGHALLLQAMARLPKSLPWVLGFAGSTHTPYAATLMGLAKELGIGDRLRWLGTRADIPRLLAASTLAFSTSTRPEAFGRAAIEAMAMGTPVIATGHGGSLETVRDGETGWLLPPEPQAADALEGFRPQALAEKIEEALRLPKRLVTMGKTARKHVVDSFTVARCCEAELSAYKRFAPRSRPTKE